MNPTNRTPRLRDTVLAVTAAAILLAACGSSSGNTITPLKTTPTVAGASTTTTVRPPSTTVVQSTTVLTGDAAIIAADQAASATFISLAKANPVDPSDPGLAKHAAGKQLVNQRAILNMYFFHQHHLVGEYTGSQYRVVQHIGNSAVVLSCDLDMTAVVDNTTGQVVTPAPNKGALANTRLDLVNGQWMVTDAGIRSPTC